MGTGIAIAYAFVANYAVTVPNSTKAPFPVYDTLCLCSFSRLAILVGLSEGWGKDIIVGCGLWMGYVAGCGGMGGHIALDIYLYSPLEWKTEFLSCVKVEVAVLGFPS